MSDASNEFLKIEHRANDLRLWLKENAPECTVEQKHLDEGSTQRAYWHYGYLMALNDVMGMFSLNPLPAKTAKEN